MGYGQYPYGAGGYKGKIAETIPPPAEAVVPVNGDILFQFFQDLKYADIIMGDDDLERDPGLETCVLISLFSDRRAKIEDNIPDKTGKKRGWWPSPIDEFEWGSRLWLLDRSKITDEVLSEAEEYAKEALQWMIDDNVAERVEVNAARIALETISLEIRIYSPTITDPNNVYTFRYSFNWREQLLKGSE